MWGGDPRDIRRMAEAKKREGRKEREKDEGRTAEEEWAAAMHEIDSILMAWSLEAWNPRKPKGTS